MKFYRISDEYIQFLQQIDRHVLNNRNEQRGRPYVGIVLTFGVHQYFAPISSYKPKHDKISNHTVHKIIDGNNKLAVIKLNCMFPIIQSEIEEMNFKNEEKKYKDLLEQEYRVVQKEQQQIKHKAKKMYEDIEKGKPFFTKISCDYPKLEQEYVKFVRKTK